MPGPPPKHPSTRARRNDAKKDFTTLPLAGREGPPPAFPLRDDVFLTSEREVTRDRIASLQVEVETCEDARKKGRLKQALDRAEFREAFLTSQIEESRETERELWNTLWAMPQAVMWEASNAHREVAQYVRWKIRAEQGDLKAASEARQWSDRLGLNPLALLRLRVEIEQAEAAEDRGRRRRSGGGAGAKKPTSKGDPRAGLYAV